MHKEKSYPLISVVMPAYNAETTIASSLESIIAQDYPNLEIIVVNDASQDKTKQAARRVLEGCGRPFSIITHTKNRGVSAARNTGIDAMQGEFLWFMDADDKAEPNLVSKLIQKIFLPKAGSISKGPCIALCARSLLSSAAGIVCDIKSSKSHKMLCIKEGL